MTTRARLFGLILAVALVAFPAPGAQAGDGGEGQCLYLVTDGCQYDLRGFQTVQLNAPTPFTATVCSELDAHGGQDGGINVCATFCISTGVDVSGANLAYVYVGWRPGTEISGCPRPPVADVTIRWA